jgi:hypothetical protein
MQGHIGANRSVHPKTWPDFATGLEMKLRLHGVAFDRGGLVNFAEGW